MTRKMNCRQILRQAESLAVAIAIATLMTTADKTMGQNTVVDLTLERSENLTDWGPVSVTGDMLTEEGTILLPDDKQAEFFRLKVTTVEVPPPPPPEGFALIPAGTFLMGNDSGGSNERPAHSVNVSEFSIARTEMTKEQWDIVTAWGWSNGYSDLPLGEGKAPDHPVQMVNWFDVVKWLNAWSEMEGRTPVYTLGGEVFRTGTGEPVTDFSVNGYRLPTEAEWEKAARGGLTGRTYSWWENVLTPEHANALGTVPATEDPPLTLPVGSFAPNLYGLYDTTGNVWEWVGDWYSDTYYGDSPSADPSGPDNGNFHVLRGGSFVDNDNSQRASYRNKDIPENYNWNIGFRCAKNLP